MDRFRGNISHETRLIEAATEYGTKAAWCRHKAHDESMCKVWQQRQRVLEIQNEPERTAIANAYREAYSTESSYYIGQHIAR